MKLKEKTLKEKMTEIIRGAIANNEELSDGLIEVEDEFLKLIKKTQEETKKEIEKIITDEMKQFASTRLDKRGNGWDWLKRVRDKIENL